MIVRHQVSVFCHDPSCGWFESKDAPYTTHVSAREERALIDTAQTAAKRHTETTGHPTSCHMYEGRS